MSETIKLAFPARLPDRKAEEIKLRRPLLKDRLELLDNSDHKNLDDQVFWLAQRLSGWNEDDLKQIDDEDWEKVEGSETMRRFFRVGRGGDAEERFQAGG